MDGILEKCIQIESELFVDLNDNVKVISKKGYLITTNHDIVLLLHKIPIIRQYVYIGQDFITFAKKSNGKHVNLLITKNYMLYEWENYIDTKVFHTFRSFQEYLDMLDITSTQMLLVISENNFMNNFNFIGYRVHVDRIFFDNIIITNSIKLKVSSISYTFMWLIYDKIPNIQQPNSLFDRLIVYDIPLLLHHNEIDITIKCKKPYIVSTLSDLVDKSVEEELSNLDINLALQHLSSKNIQPEQRILSKVLGKLNTTLSNILIKENLLNALEDNHDKANRLDNILSKKRNIEDKISQIQQRITSNELCFICYSDISTKTVMKCCYNVVCFVCINKWLHHVNKCPLCKIDNPEYFVQQNDHIPSKEIVSISNNNTIFENFIVLIKKLYNDDAHYTLILGNEDLYIQKFETIMKRLGLQYVQLKGNSFVFKKHTNSKRKILTMNSKRYEQGVKINYISDIIVLNSSYVNSTLLEKCLNLKTVWKLCYL